MKSLAFVLWAGGVVVWVGCGKLRADPGHEFAVRATPYPTIGVIEEHLPFTVAGCDEFAVAIEAPSGALYPVSHTRDPDGGYVATVPTEYLRTEDHTCVDDFVYPQEGAVQLVVTCADTGRSVSTTVHVRYGTANRALRFSDFGEDRRVVQLFEGLDPLRPIAYWDSHGVSLGTGEYATWDLSRGPGGTTFVDQPVIRLAPPDGGGQWYIGSFMRKPGVVAVADGVEAPAGDLQQLLAFRSGSDGPATYLQNTPEAHTVAGDVRDLAFARGELVILSELPHGPCDPRAIVVSSIGRQAAAPTILAYLPDEVVATGLRVDGETGLVSFVGVREQEGTAVLHSTDGHTLTSRSNLTSSPIVDSSRVPCSTQTHASYDKRVWVSPDGANWIWVGYDGFHIGSPDGAWNRLPVRNWGVDEVAWLPEAVAVRYGALRVGDDGSGAVDVFDLAPPHALRFTYDVHPLPGSDAFAELKGMVAIGYQLALTTSTGIRVLGRDGTLIAGADPLPCGLLTTAPAISAGLGMVAVAASPYVYLFGPGW